MTGRRWSETWRRRGRFGGECWGSWAERGRVRKCPDFSLKPSFSRCCSLVQRRGLLPPTWDGYWGVSKTRWRGDWRLATIVEVVQKVGVHLGGGGERGGGFWDYGDVHLAKSEYSRAVYCNVANYRPMQGGEEEDGNMGGYTVVGKSGTWTGRGKGDGDDGSGGGRGWAEGIKGEGETEYPGSETPVTSTR